nr:hypothetical protein [Tanacetum cinerariifolium]
MITSLPPPPQQSMADPILVKRIGELEQHMANLLQYNLAMEERLNKHGSRLYKLENLNIAHQVNKAVDEIVTDAVDCTMQAPLQARFSDLPTVDMKEKSLECDYSDQLLSDLEEACQKKRKRRDLPRTPFGSPPSQPPPPPPPASASGALAGISGTQELSLMDSLIQNDSIPDEQVHFSDDEDFRNDHLPKADSRKDWWKPLPKEERPMTPKPAWTIPSFNTGYMMNFLNWYYRQVNKTELTQADLDGQAYKVVKAFYPNVIHLQFQIDECHKLLTDQVEWTNLEGDQVRVDVNRPLPLSGPPGYVTIQTQFFFNKDLEYLIYGSKGSSLALSISKRKADSYPDFGLELLVSEQMWIDDVCTYDINDLQEHTIAEKDFKNLYPSDFKDLNMLLPQGHLDHLSGSDKRMLSTVVKLWTRNLVIQQRVKDFQLGIESYQTQLNLTKPRWDATGYEFKHDYIIIEYPRVVVFPVNNNERKIMRFNEIYKFSDGTLTRILEALAYRVKEFKIKRLNPGMNTRVWTQKDVTRSKEFKMAIEMRLKTRRIYRNLVNCTKRPTLYLLYRSYKDGKVRVLDIKIKKKKEATEKKLTVNKSEAAPSLPGSFSQRGCN